MLLTCAICFLLVYFKITVGVSKRLDCDIGVVGQPRNVEPEICNLGKTVSWAAVISQGLECSA